MSDLQTLQTDIANHLDRSDIATQVILYEKLARKYLERHYRPKFLEAKALQTPAKNAFDIPNDCLGIIQVSLIVQNAVTILTRKTEGFVRQNSNVLKYYYREQSVGYLGKTPASGAVVEIDYYQSQPNLVNATDTHKWLTDAYEVIFFATAWMLCTYLKDFEEAAASKEMLDMLVLDLEHADVANNHSDYRAQPGD